MRRVRRAGARGLVYFSLNMTLIEQPEDGGQLHFQTAKA